MKRVYRIDQEGYYVEDVILEDGEELAANLIDIEAPQGLYKLKFDGAKWVEGLSQAEIDEIRNQPSPKSELELLEERLSLSESAIDFILMNGGI